MFSDHDNGSHIVDDLIEAAGPQYFSLERRGGGRDAEGRRGVQRVADVQIVREGFRPVLGGMHGGIRGHIVFFPVGRWTVLVVLVQRRLVVGVGIAVQFPKPFL